MLQKSKIFLSIQDGSRIRSFKAMQVFEGMVKSEWSHN